MSHDFLALDRTHIRSAVRDSSDRCSLARSPTNLRPPYDDDDLLKKDLIRCGARGGIQAGLGKSAC